MFGLVYNLYYILDDVSKIKYVNIVWEMHINQKFPNLSSISSNLEFSHFKVVQKKESQIS